MLNSEGTPQQHPENPEMSFDEIKANLAKASSDIPFVVWKKRFPNFQAPLDIYKESSQLAFHSLEAEGIANGSDVVQSTLGRNGKILEILVHYDMDFPDEFLGEAGEERYRGGYDKAMFSLGLLSEDTRELIQNQKQELMARYKSTE